MKLNTLPTMALIIASSFTSAQVRQADPETGGTVDARGQFTAELRAGLEYDSNVSLEEVDQSSGESDYAAVLDGQLKYKAPLGKHSKVTLSYDFSQSLYDEFSAVDRQTHLLSAGLSRDLGKLTAGGSYRYIYSRLDGDKFLTLHQVSPQLSGFLAKKWFARGAYTWSDKQIDPRGDRDATYHAGELDIYYFVSGLRSYFDLGYRYKSEDARADRFDYRSNRVKLRYVQRFDFFARQTKMSLALRYENRDYSSITPGIREKREDDRYRAEAEFELPVGEQAAISIYYRYSDNQSNQPSADYDQTLAGGQFLYRW